MSFCFTQVLARGALVSLLGLNACSGPECPVSGLEQRRVHVRDASLTVEIAATAAQRACGLSLRDRMDVNHGMLFVYRDDGIREFWMKDTLIPLTIAFLDAEGRITELRDMDPRAPQRRLRSREAVRYALETHRGWFDANGIGVGDRVQLYDALQFR